MAHKLKTHTSRSTVHGCHTGKSSKRGCSCTVATSKNSAFEGWWFSFQVLVHITRAHKKRRHFGAFMGLIGSSSAESDPVVTCQLARLRTLRARATKPGRGPNLRRGMHAPPLRGTCLLYTSDAADE